MKMHLMTYNWYETGMEGIEYCLANPDLKGYEKLIQLNDGDHLTIPGKFQGYIKKVTKNPYGLSWAQEGWNKEDWALLFLNPYEAIYRKKQEEKSIYTLDFQFII